MMKMLELSRYNPYRCYTILYIFFQQLMCFGDRDERCSSSKSSTTSRKRFILKKRKRKRNICPFN